MEKRVFKLAEAGKSLRDFSEKDKQHHHKIGATWGEEENRLGEIRKVPDNRVGTGPSGVAGSLRRVNPFKLWALHHSVTSSYCIA